MLHCTAGWIYVREELSEQAVEASPRHLWRADLMLMAGSSLEVTPVAGYPLRVYGWGGRITTVNLTPTYIGDTADVVIRGDVAEVLPRVARACEEG